MKTDLALDSFASGKPLDQLKLGQAARVLGLASDLADYERQRLHDLGLVPNTLIEVAKNGLKQQLRAYSWRGAVVALRQSQASRIFVEPQAR